MSSFVSFALEKSLPGVDTHIDGEALLANMAELDTLAVEVGVEPLGNFVDTSAADHLLGTKSKPLWRPARQAYQTVIVLLSALDDDDEAPEVRDLRIMKKALAEAQKRKIRFHLELSI